MPTIPSATASGAIAPASRLKEVHTRTHPARFALDPELAAELADEEAHDELGNKAD